MINMGTLFENPQVEIFGQNKLELTDIAYLICRGGWPLAAELKGDDLNGKTVRIFCFESLAKMKQNG